MRTCAGGRKRIARPARRQGRAACRGRAEGCCERPGRPTATLSGSARFRDRPERGARDSRRAPFPSRLIAPRQWRVAGPVQSSPAMSARYGGGARTRMHPDCRVWRLSALPWTTAHWHRPTRRPRPLPSRRAEAGGSNAGRPCPLPVLPRERGGGYITYMVKYVKAHILSVMSRPFQNGLGWRLRNCAKAVPGPSASRASIRSQTSSMLIELESSSRS